MNQSSQGAVRSALTYCAFFHVVATYHTYLPSYLKNELHFSGTHIFILFFIGSISIGMISQIWSGQFADRTGAPVELLKVYAVCHTLCVYALFFCYSPWTFVLCLWPMGFFSASAPSLMDVIVIRKYGSENYSRVRLGGAIGFGVAVFSFPFIGKFLSQEFPQYFPTPLSSIFFVLSVYVTLYTLFVLRFPNDRFARTKKSEFSSAKTLLSSRNFRIFLAYACFHWTAHTPYNSLLDIHRGNLGLTIEYTAFASVTGVVAEVVCFATAHIWLRLLHARTWLFLASAITAVRWALMAHFLTPEVFVALQALHSFSFAIFWIASIHYLISIVPDNNLATGQTFLTMATFSIGTILGSIINGLCIDAPGSSFFVFVVAAFVGCIPLFLLPMLDLSQNELYSEEN